MVNLQVVAQCFKSPIVAIPDRVIRWNPAGDTIGGYVSHDRSHERMF